MIFFSIIQPCLHNLVKNNPVKRENLKFKDTQHFLDITAVQCPHLLSSQNHLKLKHYQYHQDGEMLAIACSSTLTLALDLAFALAMHCSDAALHCTICGLHATGTAHRHNRRDGVRSRLDTHPHNNHLTKS